MGGKGALHGHEEWWRETGVLFRTNMSKQERGDPKKRPSAYPAERYPRVSTHAPLARSLHAITGFNDREQSILNFPLPGFTGRSPIEDVLKDAAGIFKFAARFLQVFWGLRQLPRHPNIPQGLPVGTKTPYAALTWPACKLSAAIS